MHPLASAPHSFKELAIHVGIVTVGILIALSLEGLRESIHDHHLVREARDSFRLEIDQDLRQMNKERPDIEQVNQATRKVIADLPVLTKDPTQLRQRVDALMPGLYTLTSSSWPGALSSGALSHMGADEVSQYAGFDYDVREYTSLEERALTQLIDLHSYVDSRHAFGSQEMDEIDDKLRSFETLTQIMRRADEETSRDMNKARPN